jgi:hypothetical protein
VRVCPISYNRLAILDLEIEKDEVNGAPQSAPFFFASTDASEAGSRRMKKAKPRTGAGRSKGPSAVKAAAKAIDLEEIRRQIGDLVGNGAVDMVERTMEEVGKGHYLGMKYLFEMIGLYPATSTDDGPLEDSLAAILLRRLDLPEAPMPEAGVTEGSGRTAAASEDVLE